MKLPVTFKPQLAVFYGIVLVTLALGLIFIAWVTGQVLEVFDQSQRLPARYVQPVLVAAWIGFWVWRWPRAPRLIIVSDTEVSLADGRVLPLSEIASIERRSKSILVIMLRHRADLSSNTALQNRIARKFGSSATISADVYKAKLDEIETVLRAAHQAAEQATGTSA